MIDLFNSQEGLRKLDLSGADVSYREFVDFGVPAEIILDSLINDTAWKQENIQVWGKTFQQPRLTAWYGDEGQNYSYSGVKLTHNTWSALLLKIKQKIEFEVGNSFNSVLLNYYRNQNDSMGMHSDDEVELGQDPVIASVSFGSARVFRFQSRHAAIKESLGISLSSGSLLLMKGSTQRNYKHGIAKSSRQIGPRVNLTFRLIKN